MKVLLNKIRKVWLIISIVLALVLTTAFNDNVNFEIIKNLDIYYSLFRELNVYYVDEINPSDAIKKSIDAMLNSLDPYTVFIPESQIEDLRFMTTGQYGGIGAIIQKRNDDIIISELYEHYPAQKAGIQAGDAILEIDGKSTKGKKVEEVSEILKGQPNTTISLKIKKVITNEIKTVTLTRQEIKISNIPYYGIIEQNIGYIYLSNFTENASTEFLKAFNDLKTQGMKELVLDLRGNPGGLLMEAVNLMSFFVPKGTLIVSTKGRIKDWEKEYRSNTQPIDINIPIIVLVNSTSASASEIIAGAFQDLDRGIIIGQRTFGKGLVQTTRDLSYNAKLKVTTAKYYTPSGRCIQAIDYSHRNPDGSVGKIPDSLVKAFKTLNGRIVYDGGGIKPDIEIEPKQISPITEALLTNFIIFDYANKYYYEHPLISELNNVVINEKIYQNFIQFSSSYKFDYQTQSEKVLEELSKSLKEDKYYELTKENLEQLKQQIKHNKEQDFKLFENEIKQFLFEEIASRYYYQKGRILAMLRDDPVLQKAKEILTNPAKYKALLKPEP